MWSYWERAYLIGEVDLIIVGSGIVGLSAAIYYKKCHPKKRIIVLEAGVLPAGASTKNAGFACFGSPSEVLMDIDDADSPESVFQLLDQRWRGLQNLKNLLGQDKIGYQENGSYELFTNEQDTLFNNVLSHLPALNQEISNYLGFEPYVISDSIIQHNGFNGMLGAIEIKREGEINTGLMMRAMLHLASEMGIDILNGFHVEAIEEEAQSVKVMTKDGYINGRNCLIATNGFASKLVPNKKVEPARAQVLITRPIPNLSIKGTYHFDCGYYYFRTIDNRILFGGGRNLDFENERTTEKLLSNKIQDSLDGLLSTRILPQTAYEIDYRWAGIMGIGHGKEPFVESISERVHIAVKLGGMGIAIGCLVGQKAAKLMN